VGQPERCRPKVAFILVDGQFEPSLRDMLPAGAVDGLMHGGPKG
jgi:hypothetical protein